MTRCPAPLCAVSWRLYQVAGTRSEMMRLSSSDLRGSYSLQSCRRHADKLNCLLVKQY